MTQIAKGIYRHYKGPYYKVLDVATHSESEESLVVYQTLYGDNDTWVRPLSMFAESVDVNGEACPRFAYVDPQTEVLEMAVLNVKPGQAVEFESVFERAQAIISSMQGYISHSLSRCLEQDNQYLLLVNWQSLEHHETGFRQSPEYLEWKALLHHFYDPFPTIEHYVSLYP